MSFLEEAYSFMGYLEKKRRTIVLCADFTLCGRIGTDMYEKAKTEDRTTFYGEIGQLASAERSQLETYGFKPRYQVYLF